MSTDSLLGEMQELIDVLTEIHGDTYNVTIVCSDGNEISANQIILRWASEVFRAMFRNKMEESKTKTVIIEDISSDTMKMIIDFLASGQLPSLDDLLKDEMSYALDKYDFKCMKSAIAAKLVDTDVKNLCVAYELLKNLHMVEDKKKLANRMAFHFRSLPLDQLEKLDADAFLWISQSLKDHVGSGDLKAANDTREDVWTNFLKIYNGWLSSSPCDAAKHAEKVIQTVELHLLDVQTIVDLLSKSPVFDLISPCMAAIIRRLMGLEQEGSIKRKVQDHMNQCGTDFARCNQCRCYPTSTQLHYGGYNCPARVERCSVCNCELQIPPSIALKSSTQAGFLRGWPLDFDSFSS